MLQLQKFAQSLSDWRWGWCSDWNPRLAALRTEYLWYSSLTQHTQGNSLPLYSVMYAMRCASPRTLALHMLMYTSQRNVDVTCLTKLHFESDMGKHQYRRVGEAKHFSSQMWETIHQKKLSNSTHGSSQQNSFKCKYPNYGKTVTARWYLNWHYKIHSLDLKYGWIWSMVVQKSAKETFLKFHEQKKWNFFGGYLALPSNHSPVHSQFIHKWSTFCPSSLSS